MSRRELNQALRVFPEYVRERVLSYADTVAVAAPEICRDAGIHRPSQELTDSLVFVSGIRKLWAMIEFQNRTLSAVLDSDTMGFQGVTGRAGYMTRGSDAYEEIIHLRDELRQTLEETDVSHMVRAPTLQDVARILDDSR